MNNIANPIISTIFATATFWVAVIQCEVTKQEGFILFVVSFLLLNVNLALIDIFEEMKTRGKEND